MLESFFWMFKTEDFKNHFFKLFKLIFIIWIPLIISYICIYKFMNSLSIELQLIIKIIFISILFLPFLCTTGYFWILCDNIIYRKVDICANNIYNKKFKIINKFDLPEWNILKFIWRGIASIVATIIMCIPLVLIINTSYLNLSNVAEFWGWNNSQITIFSNILAIIGGVFIPGLLWNYAKRDSIIATLNIFKAIYLMESYPLRYLAHSFLFIILSVINALFIVYIAIALNINLYNILYSLLTNSNILLILLLLLIFYVLGLYLLYVYAYILGTLAPNSEN